MFFIIHCYFLKNFKQIKAIYNHFSFQQKINYLFINLTQFFFTLISYLTYYFHNYIIKYFYLIFKLSNFYLKFINLNLQKNLLNL
jgi:hypothetical protein